LKILHGVDGPGQQAFLGSVNADPIVQERLRHGVARARVGDQTVLLPHRLHHQFPILVRGDPVPDPEPHPLERRIVARVLPELSRGGKHEIQAGGARLHQGAETQFRLGFTDPPLPVDKIKSFTHRGKCRPAA
jgi:hypothetical protein